MNDPLVGVTAHAQAEAVRTGAVNAAELMSAHLEQIDRLDQSIGAFQVVRRERALHEAEQLDARADLEGLPLAGVPVAIKDNVAVEGEPTRDGTLATPDTPSPRDHEVVRRIRAAGGIVIGKTRVPELCTFAATDSAFGITRNPWDIARTSGGSSGGSAAAVAAAMVAIAHGNDGMGSVRIPAACCGVVGVKPGTGIVPGKLGRNDWYGLAQNGVLATTVSDAALLLDVMAGSRRFRDPRAPREAMRLAISTRSPSPLVTVDPELSRCVVDVGEMLSGCGHSLDTIDPPHSLGHGLAAFFRWAAGVADDAEELGRRNLETRNRRHSTFGRLAKRAGWVGPEARERWRAAVAPLFERVDALITPTLAQPPIAGEEWSKKSWSANMRANAGYAPFTPPWNLADFPAASIPAGVHSAGTPLSVQVIVQAGDEEILLSICKQIEDIKPWTRLAPVSIPPGR